MTELHHMTVKKLKRQARRERINNTAYGAAKSLAQAGEKECRWPVDDLFCCAPIEKGSYCKHHSAIAYLRKRTDEHSVTHC